MLHSLHFNTAELPKVQLGGFSEKAWPVSTQQAIGQGVGRMQKAMVDSVAAQLQDEHGVPPAIWLTGGFAQAGESAGSMQSAQSAGVSVASLPGSVPAQSSRRTLKNNS